MRSLAKEERVLTFGRPLVGALTIEVWSLEEVVKRQSLTYFRLRVRQPKNLEEPEG